MRDASSVWEPSGLIWLENNLGCPWPDALEREVRREWSEKEDWALNCHPWTALLLLIREYLTVPASRTEPRLRRLLPILAGRGDPGQVVAALSLLGIVVIDGEGRTAETDALFHHLRREITEPGVLNDVLRRFFCARAAVVSGNVEEACRLFGELLDVKPGDPVTESVLGRVYEKAAVFLRCRPARALESRWRMAAERWCEKHPLSIPARRLKRWLEAAGDVPAELVPEDPFDREEEIMIGLAGAKQEPNRERLRYLAKVYGDPYWIRRVEELAFSSSEGAKAKIGASGVAEYRFTFFESFQGYGPDGNTLFPERYSRKTVKQVLALLLLQPRYRMVKDKLWDVLFGEASGETGENYLHVILYRVRRLFLKQTGIADGWVHIRDGMVVFNENRVGGVDVQEYRQLASVGHQLWVDDREAAVSLYRRAAEMYRPVVAPEFEYEDWMAAWREELFLHQKRILRRLWDYARETAGLEQAVQYGEALLALDEWDLSTVHQLCKDWKSMGDHTRVTRICERYFRRITEDSEEIPPWMREFLGA
ncbi:MAG: bacterial transcriptional activator domain-containing protein [Alicyclobacillaceae bacterium]|nr:bacterial transcriptional activator domain-containing protein [Alicyclobacillaceae bacterium]